MSDDLTRLQAEFPAYRIWREHLLGRSRYVARSRYQGLNPHTVVTPDLGELRGALQPGQGTDAAAPSSLVPPRRRVAILRKRERGTASTRRDARNASS